MTAVESARGRMTPSGILVSVHVGPGTARRNWIGADRMIDGRADTLGFTLEVMETRLMPGNEVRGGRLSSSFLWSLVHFSAAA